VTLFQWLLRDADGNARLGAAQWQFVRYVIVGLCNTGFGYGAFAALLFLGLGYKLASLLALLMGIAFSFTTQGTIVFRNATRVTFVKFVLAWVCLYLLNIGLIALMVRASLSPYLAGAIATVPVTLVSYFVLKFAVFDRAQPAARTEPMG
jgi:putative flippase GtrA